MELSDAIVRLRNKDTTGALRALLAAWRTTKHPRIAALIDTVDRRIRRPKTLPGDTEAERLASWFTLARSQRPEVFKQLAAALWPTDVDVCRRMLEVLATWPADPRFTRPLCAYMRAPRFTSWTPESGVADALAEPITDLLWASGDVRVARQILAVDHPSHPLAVEPWSPRPQLFVGAHLAAELRRVPLPALDGRQLADLAELERLLRLRDSATVERAFARVYGKRDAPEARAVFVDQLHALRHPDAKYFDGRTCPQPSTCLRMVPDALYDLKRMGFSPSGHLVDKGRLVELPTADRLAQPHWANLTALWLPADQAPLRAYPWFARLPTVLGVDPDTAGWAATHGVSWRRLGTDDLDVVALLRHLPTVTHVNLYLPDDELESALALVAAAPQVTMVSIPYVDRSGANQPSLPGVEFRSVGYYPDFGPLHLGW